MSNAEAKEISKFISYALRHRPDAVGIEIDSEGWVNVADLMQKVAENGHNLTPSLLIEIVENSDKRRFSLSEDGTRMRALQGHSTASVSIKYVPRIPPEFLYHGTAKRFLSAILEEGILPLSRHYVHLSVDGETAINIGKRHGSPIVLSISALKMHECGHEFFKADNGVWLTKIIPPNFLQVL